MWRLSTIIYVVCLIHFINITYAKTSETEPVIFYASPTGKGNCTRLDSPCDFLSAISFAATSSSQQVNIQLLPGYYKDKAMINNFSNLTIIATSKNNSDVIFTYSLLLLDTFLTLTNSHVTFDSVQFIELNETIISVTKGSVNFVSCKFINNTKKKPNSGGLLIKSDELSPVIVRNSTITGNSLYSNISSLYTNEINGFLILAYSTVEIHDTEIFSNTIEGNFTYLRGGLVYSELNMTIKNSMFSNNQIRGMYQVIEGGAIFTKMELNIFNSIFAATMISTERKYSDGPENIVVSGGSIYSQKTTIISNTQFENNYIMIFGYFGAQGFGGAVYTVGELYVDSSNFTYNFIDIDASEQPPYIPYQIGNFTETIGGAIFGSVIYITDTLFIDNSCSIVSFSDNEIEIFTFGGAINGDILTINNCIFSSNFVRSGMNKKFSSTSEISGGAISSDQVSISQSRFNNNQAFHSGGAVYISAYINGSQESSVQDSTFIVNIASGNVMSNGGGAIYFYSPPIISNQPGLLTVNSSIFYNNEAEYGSDIFLINTQSKITDSGSVVVYNYDNYYDAGSTTPSPTPSFNSQPSPSSNKGSGDSDIWWAIIVCVFSAVFILVVIAIIGVVSVYLRKRRNQPYTAHSIELEIEERDDHFD